jgi:hypothetical protein
MEVNVQLYPRDMSLEAANGSKHTVAPTLNFSARREWLVKDTLQEESLGANCTGG